LKDVTAFGPKEAHMQNTLLIGKAGSLASHLKGLNYVDDIKALTYLAAELGITGFELKYVLKELEEVDFATIVGTESKIKRIELRIPEFRDGYEDLGERWLQLKPTEIEHASIQVLETVASFPQKEELIKNKLGLDNKAFNTILTIGSTGALVDKYETEEDESILYSPLTVEEEPSALLSLAKKFPEDLIVTVLKEVQKQQGIPLTAMRVTDPNVVTEAVLLGVLCPIRITSGSQERTFLFTPKGRLRKEERVILEKARAILACVRYGEHYADVKKILYPKRILETLRDKKRFAYPRPDFPEQYGLLVTMQIGFIEKDKRRPGFFNFFLHDTKENLHALDIAIDLLELGTSPKSKLEVDAKEFLSVGGTFSGTLPSRSKMGKGVSRSKGMARDILKEISKLARGVIK
jgi:hypothetical protein